jgi:hypothetical protein
MVGGSGAASTSFPPLPIAESHVLDDFLARPLIDWIVAVPGTPSLFGDYGWRAEVVADSGTIYHVAGWENDYDDSFVPLNRWQNHPGIVGLQVPETVDDIGAAGHVALYSPGKVVGFSLQTQYTAKWIFRVYRYDSDDSLIKPLDDEVSNRLFIGFTGSGDSIPTNVSGLALFVDVNADPNWQLKYVDNAGADQIIDTGIAPDTDWHQLTLDYDPDTGNVRLYLDDALLVTQSLTGTFLVDPTEYKTVMPIVDLSIAAGDPNNRLTIVEIDRYENWIRGLDRYTPA